MRAGTAAAMLLALAVSAGCGEPAPRALRAGVDSCAGCLMAVDANGHGAEVVTRTGKVYTFDSVECMVSHLASLTEPPHSSWVTDFGDPGRMVRADTAYYLVSATLASPMGLGITAFGRAADRDGAVHAFGGQPADWDRVRRIVTDAWPHGSPNRHGGHAETITPALSSTNGNAGA